MTRKLLDWLDHRTNYRALLAPLRRRVLPNGPSWWFTSASCLLWLFIIQLVTGLLLMTTYSPSMTSAWESVHYIEGSAAGGYIRGVHYFASHAMLVLFAVHVIRVLLTGAFRAPRELIWMTGLLLMPLILVWAVTGNPLSASQSGIAQIEVEGNIVGSTPVIGPLIRRILIGGEEVGQLTLTHLYFLHAGLLPLLAIGLLGLHLSQVYRHGPAHSLGTSDQKAKPYWPYQSVRNMTVLAGVVGTISVLAWKWGAPLTAPADANLEHSPRPEWYFRFLFELRRYFTGDWEFIATLVIPTVALLFFLTLPSIDRRCSARLSAAFRLLVVAVAAGSWGWLTWASYSRDALDSEFLASREKGIEWAERAQVLAGLDGIPPAGAVTLLRGDPKTQGPLLFARHCAACHPHTDASGKGIVVEQPSAPNLFGVGSIAWIAGLLDPAELASDQYFGKTRFADGEMVGKMHELFEDVEGEDLAALRRNLHQVSVALAAEAGHVTPAADHASEQAIDEGRRLLTGDLACTDCHRFRDQGELGSAPDLTGYASRDWLMRMISNPQHERFYGDGRNDRMPAFAKDTQHPDRNLLGPRELELLVDWLRGVWYEPDARESSDGARPTRRLADR